MVEYRWNNIGEICWNVLDDIRCISYKYIYYIHIYVYIHNLYNAILNINVHLKNEQILFEVYVKIRASMLRIWGVSRWKFCRKIGCSGRGHVKEKTTYLRSRLVVKHATLAAMLAVPERRVSGKSPPDRNTDSCTHWVRNNISSMTGQPTDLQGKSPLSHSMFRQWYLPVL